MVSRDITYTDYDGVEKTERFWFNLTPADVQELDLAIPGGLNSVTKDLETDPNIRKVLDAFKLIILKAYGVRTPDKKFYKDDIETKAFAASDAFSQLFMNFLDTDDKDDVINFVSAMFPQGISQSKVDEAKTKLAVIPQDHKKAEQ